MDYVPPDPESITPTYCNLYGYLGDKKVSEATCYFEPGAPFTVQTIKVCPEYRSLRYGTQMIEFLRDKARANFHFRMVEVVMMALLPLLAVALAVPPKRSTSGLGIFISIVMVVTYHKINQYAEQMGAQDRIDPVIALWTPFAFFAALIVWMYWTLAHKPGGQPIGALERAFAKLGKTIGRVFKPRRRRTAAQ